MKLSAMGEHLPDAHGEAVILVHGLARTWRSMRKVQQFLEQGGYRVLNFRYPSTQYPLEMLSEQYLWPFVQTRCPDQSQRVHFVTHSMGGILVRLFLKEHFLEQVGRVVMLAPPNQGSEVTDWLKSWFLYRWIMGPAGLQLGTDAESIPIRLGPVNFELGVIAGDRSMNPLNSLRIPGCDDGKVSVERTKAQGMKDFLIVNQNHTFIMRNHEVLAQVEQFLRHGRFRRNVHA